MFAVAGTGHRPEKLHRGREPVGEEMLFGFVTGVLRDMPILPRKVISGMALGYDTALARAALASGIPLHAFVPFAGQELWWPERHQIRYREILAKATEVKICLPGGYAPSKMQYRNERIVRELAASDPFAPGSPDDVLLALWSGAPGGTANCIEYAISQGRTIENLWDRWISYVASTIV